MTMHSKRAWLLWAASGIAACGGGTPGATSPPAPTEAVAPAGAPAPDSNEALARAVVEQLSRGELGAVVARFDDTMQSKLGHDQLAEVWDGLIRQVGPVRSIEDAAVSQKEGYDIVTVIVRFDKAPMAVRVVFDADQRIAGLFFAPAPSKEPYQPPPYADVAAIDAHEVTVGSGQWALPGTLTVPKGKTGCPAVVLVHGSGPNDRDESVGGTKPFRDLALGLSSRGICVLRYEKRTKHHGQALVEKLGQALTLTEETLEDAVLAVKLLRERPEIDPKRIFVIGHSLGGTAIPRIAALDAGVRGFVIMAGASLSLEDAVLRQLRYIAELDGQISDNEKQALDKLQTQVARVKSLKAGDDIPAGELPLGIPVPYWLDLAAHPPTEGIAKVTRPLLVLHADRDYQVVLDDFEGWKKALKGKPNATFKRYAKLNHLFVAGEGPSAPPEYLKAGHVDAEVIDDIASWIASQ